MNDMHPYDRRRLAFEIERVLHRFETGALDEQQTAEEILRRVEDAA